LSNPVRMRSYSLILNAIAFGLFGAVAALNVMVDPEGVLETGLLGPAQNANDRAKKVRACEASPDAYDALLFGSSRGNAIPLEALSAHMGGAKFAHFGVAVGLIDDHEAALEFVVRSKAAQGKALRAVFRTAGDI
jgi:hypothetical protein